jgi:hypothetical protein
MLFGVKANVGSNPTVTADEKGPASLCLQRKQGLLLCTAHLFGHILGTFASEMA